MEKVIIGVDPHELSATIEVVDEHEKLLGSGRFTTERARYVWSIRALGRRLCVCPRVSPRFQRGRRPSPESLDKVAAALRGTCSALTRPRSIR
jgi:hypothetical protein